VANYIYLPVNSDEMCSLARKAADHLDVPVTNILANKVTAGIGKAMYRWVNKCLSAVRAGDTLYVMLHGRGDADSLTVAANRSVGKNKQYEDYDRGLPVYKGGESKAYTPEQLAATMKKEGLSTAVTRICLLTCGSGFAGSLPAWAQRLKNALSTHCPNLTVTGYLGDVSISPGRIKIQNGGQFFDLDERAVSF
jgi:hypothetical protein